MTKRRNLRRRSLRKSSRSLHHETLEKRELLAAEFGGGDGPRLISVAANSGEQFDLDGNNLLTVAPTELTFRFDGANPLDAATLSAIQFRASGGDGTFGDGNEQTIIPGFLGFADDSNSRIVVARFNETLADDQYTIEVAGFDDTDPSAPVVGLRNVNGNLFSPPNPADSDRPIQSIFMDIEVGPRVVAIVPQPIEGLGAARTQLRDTIHVYFNNDPLSNPSAGVIDDTTSTLSVVNPQYYKLLYTHDTVENTDDGTPFAPVSVQYDPALNRATLEFASDLSLLAPAAANNGAGTFRLRVGSGDPIPAAPTPLDGTSDAADTFTSASPLGVTFGAGIQSVVVTGGVIQAAKDVIPQWPGAGNAAGLRNYRRDAPVVGRTDTQTGINLYEYNFANLYGLDPQLNKLDNAITPAQRDRAREILGLYAARLGVEFIETENRGLQIVTGDLRALAVSADTGIDTPYSIYRVNDADPTQGVLVLDAGETWYDGYGLSPDARPSWFVESVRGIGALLGIGNTFELPPGDGSGGSSPSEPNSLAFTGADPNVPLEPDFLTAGNIITGQALHRPESDDIDFYQFRATSDGRVTLEAFAQRLESSSLLDTNLKLYRVVDAAAGDYELVASNDDFFSDDSFIAVDLELPLDALGDPIPTDFIIGVSAAGNDSYNGEVDGSGLGGLTEGAYDLRVTYKSETGSTITDTSGSELDGDADGRVGGDFNFWFRVARDTATPAADEPRVIFVDKFGGDDFLNDGTVLSPLRTISAAFAASRPEDIVRLLPNGGVDGVISTTDDNLAFEIGFGGSGNRELPDGGDFEVPKGVTVMIDAGAILKLRSAKISVGSESVDEDRSLAALQILGTPQSVDANGDPVVDGLGSVFFTSYDDATLGVDTNSLNVPPQPGNWAGIEFRNDFDHAEGRAVWESEGIFLDYSSHANIRYGGGSVSPTQPVVNALQMAESRPTLIYNTLTDNADAAISADPNSFLETHFNEPQFQRVAAFTSDYSRVGPEIAGNKLLRNSTNGLFVRVVTPAAGQLQPMTVAGRFDDHDIVHVLSQVLVLQGQPGGSLLLEQRPDVLSVTFADATGGDLTPLDFYDFRITFVTAEGRESLASLPTSMRQAPAGAGITLNNLPPAPAEFAGRRLYRLIPSTGEYEFVTQLDRATTSYVDNDVARGGLLPAAATAASRLLPRFDARLSVDPGLIVKLENARIEAGFGSDFYAEGVDGNPVIFTSRADDSFGAGGTFDTNNNPGAPFIGDWGGLVFRQDSIGSLDYVQIQYAGGTTPIEGGFTEFNPIEILQADVRVAHSVLRNNDDGFVSNSIRGGRGFNGEAAIFVRGSQPIIVDNTFIDNRGAAISINPDALDFNDVLDTGRSTGASDVVVTDTDNQGPLISGNRLDGNGINGMLVRSEILQTESVWDDTDIVHVVNGDIHTNSNYHRGGLRLKSDANQSLVVKFDNGAKLIGSGTPGDIDDRIGGTLQILGQSGFPVVLTSISDCSVGAGFTPDGLPQLDTVGSGACGVVDVGPITVPYVDVIIVMDETFTMGNAQVFTAQLILDLEAGLLARGIGGTTAGGNQYGTVGFASAADPLGRTIPVGAGGALFGTAAEYAALATTAFRSDGFTEEGYAALDFTLQNYQTRTDAAKFIIFASDEDRDVNVPSLTLGGTISNLQTEGFNFQAIVDVDIVDATGATALAIDANNVYTLDPAGGFVASPGGLITGGFGTTVQDYFSIVQATGGVAGDIDQVATSPAVANAFSQVLVSSILGQVAPPTNPSAPGDWGGIEFLSYVNDRNVAYVLESERAIPAAIGENAIADNAQVIGDLAAHEYAGDETERLGFNIRGTLADPADHDVYRFTADGGTVVYIDIDDTSFGLDTVVEVIDVNDVVLASSDNSFAETTNPGLLVNNLDPGAVLPLFQLGTGSVESPNSLDAGMRVILDGTGKDNKYYVRVRSANGQSSGQYQLSIRLRETDEIAGSTVQLADIRFATDAITVSGAPLHSPLSGSASENLNYLPDGTPVDVDNAPLVFTEANSTRIGNLLTSDRGSLRVSGTIGNINPSLAFFPSDEIDVYQVDLFAQQIEPDVFDSENRFVTTTFDIDYADQLGRVNTSLAVYDSVGRLILHSRDSNIADDVGRPLQGDDVENLAGGSVGVLDAHIGPVELPEGTYYVAVSSAIAVPAALDQFFEPNPTNTQVRLMPINSIRRIADDSFELSTLTGTTFAGGEQYTADRPIIEPLFDTTSIVPYNFDDIRLFVSYDGGVTGGTNSTLASFNPFTGVMDRLIGSSPQPTGDIAARHDGELFSFSLGPAGGPENNGNVGNFLNISPANAAATNAGDDGVSFMRNNQARNDLENDPNAQLDILALTFGLRDGSSINNSVVTDNNTSQLFLVGQRDNFGRSGEIPDIYRRNIFYTATAASGQITSRGSTNPNTHRTFNGTIPYVPFYESTSPDREWGFVDTGAIFGGGDGGDVTGLAVDPSNSRLMYAVTDLGGIHTFDYTLTVPGPSTGDFFSQANNIIPTNYFGQLTPDPFDAVSVSRGFVQLESLAFGPRQISGQEYRQTLFAVSAEGFMYAFEIDPGAGLVPSNVFYNGRSAIPLTFEGGVPATSLRANGLAFSILENSPWHYTGDRGNEQGHGSEIPYDRSRLDVRGDQSLYFGFEINANAANNTVSRDDADPLGEISPGGTQGTVISKPFSLEGYSADDKPTLYFTYFLEVEANDDYRPGPPQQRDSFRAYAAGDDGRWLLLATNDDFRSLGASDEYDLYDDTEIPVQELFDDSNAWRQARVDISPLAGNENVRIRFDFSTAGAMKHQFGSVELVAVNGDEIQDRETITLRNENFQTVVLDNIVGKDVVIPSGAVLSDGDQFTVVGPDGPFTVTFVTGPPVNPGDVQFTAIQSSDEVADAVVVALPTSLRPYAEGAGLISLLSATDVIVGNSPVGQANPVQVVLTPANQLVVPDGVNLSSGDEFTLVGATTTTRFVFVEANDAAGAPDEFVFSRTESAFALANRIIDLLPADLDPIVEIDGRITLIESPVSFTFVPASAANRLSPQGPRGPLENRIDIVVPDGNGLLDGSTLTIVDATSSTQIQFVESPVPLGPGIVVYQLGDSANTIAMRLQAQLPASLSTLLNQSGDGVLVIARDAFGAPGVTSSPIESVEVQMPSGAAGLQNDTLTLVDSAGVPLTLNFVLVATPTAPTAPIGSSPPVSNEGTVFYQFADTAQTIAANVELAFQNFYTTKLVGDTVIFFDASSFLTTDPTTSIVDPLAETVIENRLEIILPDGNFLVDGSQLRINGAEGQTTITFVFNTVPEGPGTVFFSAVDTASDIAMRLKAQLPRSMDALFNLTGDGLLVLADDAFGAPNVVDQPLIGTELITFPSGAVPLANDTVRVFDGVDNPVINFVEVAVATPPIAAIPSTPGSIGPPVVPPTPMIPGTVFYQVTDTPDQIAANFALSVANFFVTINRGDTIEVLGALNTSTTDPDTMIVHDATLGQFIQLPPTGASLINNGGDRLLILSPFGNVVVRFVEQAFAALPTDVFYSDGNSAAVIQARLQSILPSFLRAIVTQTGTSGPVVQVLGATDVIPLNPASLIQTGPSAYARSVLNLDLKDGVDIRNGEQIVIRVGGRTETMTFVRRGGIAAGAGTIQIFYDDTTLASDLYDQIVKSLPQNFQAFIALTTTPAGPGSRPSGVNIGAPGATAVVIDGIAGFTETTTDIDAFAIPISLPAGSELSDGETLTIISKDDLNGSSPITITFNLGVGAPGVNEVVYSLTDTADVITQKLYDALPRSLQGYIFSPREIYLLNASSVAAEPGSRIISFTLAPGAVPIQINAAMTSEEIAVVLQSSLAEALGRLSTVDGSNFASANDFPVIGGDRIRLYNALPIDVGSYGVSSYSSFTPSPIDAFSTNDSTPLPAEFFGLSRPGAFASNQIDGQGGANNNIEGVYIDDIIVGFAERGEMVLNAPPNNRSFVLNPEVIPDSRPQAVQPERQNETLTGPYSLEIRTSDEFGVPEDYDPINLNLETNFGSSGRSFDTNDRLVDGAVTLIAQPGQSLIDGDTFVLNDGTRQLTFEFDSILSPGVTIGNVAVPFDPSGAFEQDVATEIRNAINSRQSRDVLDITAATGNSLEVGDATGAMIELFGPAITVNPGGGRFIKMDLVAEETFQGRETSKLIPVIDHVNQTVTYVSNGDQQARAAVTGFADGTVDVLVATGKIGDQVNTGESVDDAPVILFSSPSADVDYVRIYLNAGQTVDIDVDTEGFTRGVEVLNIPLITVLDSTSAVAPNGLGGNGQTSFVAPSRAPGEIHDGAFLKFQATADGYYDVAVSASPFFGGFFGGDYGEYQLTIRPDAATSAAIPDRDVVMVDYHFGKGDVNRLQDQGQLIISSNFISDSAGFGVLATSGGRGEAFASNGNNVVPDNIPRPGSANLLRNTNTEMLVPGAVISNNVIVDSGTGGISFTGGTANNRQAPAAVPIGRIINNTVVGSGNGSGITVGSNASPTLLNNLISGFATGLNIDNSSTAAGTVVGANAFQGNANNSTIPLATTSVVITGPVFQDPARRIYIPVDGSIVIDSSFSSLPDRLDFFNTVKNPVGISASPIIAPLFDAYGQPRFDDPNINPPGAGGDIVTIDRGAIDRADRTPIVAVLTGPQDAIGTVVPGGDRDTDESFVRLVSGTVEFFEIQLLDPAGTGPDTDTITAESVLLTENGRRLAPDVDFIFGYSANSRTIRLTPLAGLWLPNAVYEITLNNQPRIAYEAPSGNQISDGDQLIISDNVGVQSVFEFESGFSVVVPQTTLLTITGTNASFQDRDTFSITAPNGNSLTFEINLSGGVAGGNVEVDLSGASTIGEVRDEILQTLAGDVPGSAPVETIMQFLDIDPIAVGQDKIQLGTLAGHTGPVSIFGLSVSGQAGGIADDQTFTYTTLTESVTFEFDSDMTLSSPDNQPVAFTRQSTPGDIAREIVAAVQLHAIGLGAAVAVDDGTVVLGGIASDVLDVTQSALLQMGTPGVTAPLTLTIPQGADGAFLDGSTFSIDVDGVAITFRYTTDPALTSPDRLILLDPTDLDTDIATKTTAVIALVYPDELSPTASGDVITLGEQAAIPPAGEPGSLTLVDGGTAGLVVDGVSGGAIPVNYLPTSPRISIAAALQGAIAASPLSVTTFSPGGGTILISGAQSLMDAVGGNPQSPVGITTPAVADLAGNPVRETRVNNETRFTIIMPDVIFDLGDAPQSYGTLFADNGARHTVSGPRLPRLGAFIDTEADGQPFDAVPPKVNQDDAALNVTVVQNPTAPGIFVIDGSTIPATDRVTLVSMPIGSETLSITVGSLARTFELVENTSNPTGSNIAVTFSNLDTLGQITTKLVRAIRAAIPQTDDGLLIAKDTVTSFAITSYDDEDGLSTANLAGFDIFTLPGTDPNNVQSSDVLGFLNPLDSSGTQIAVTIMGTGLLHGWVDFDANGIFEDDEQILRNVPVSGDPISGTPSLFTIITPSDAVDGKTWMRLRIGQDGNLGPQGVSNGGEVEDYLVDIFSSAPPILVDDQYEVFEDETLDTLNDTSPAALTPWSPVQDNDTVSIPPFLNEEYSVVDSTTNGTLVFDSSTGHFTYQPELDFNGLDTFTYRLASNAVATVTIAVKPVNDIPVLDIPMATVEILEDDPLGATITGFATSIQPGPPTATDELASQMVTISFTEINVPAGLMEAPPTLSLSGDLTIFPAVDGFGQATYLVEATDDGTPTATRSQTITINVRPVNDAPRFDPNVAGTSDMDDPDEAYSVADVDSDNDGQIDDATIAYTLREDNTQAMGVLQDYFIPLTAAPSVGYSRIGLLDVFTVGPDNEVDPLPGGSQEIEFIQAGNDPVFPSSDRTTDRGGILTPVFDTNNDLIGLNYRPPQDFNVSFAGRDSFSYDVRDNSTTGGETYSLTAGALVPDQLTTSNRVELILNPVNDRPEFTTDTLSVAVQEDSAEVNFVNYALNISAGPPSTAFDEVDVDTGQLVEFTVTSLDFPRADADDFFSIYPSINERTGLLNFQSAADVFGDFRFELVLTDSNRDGTISDNTLRGDLISSIPVTLTINVQPINDPPIVDPNADPLTFTLLEDGTVDVLVTGDGTNAGLLDPFLPGPSMGATDEAADIAPRLGGNQTVALGTPIPITSAEGGTLEMITTGGSPRLRYLPRPNFVGMDSFIYTVVDDGVTVGTDGVPFDDPRIASNTVTFEVMPVNDAPLFSGAANVQSQEDDGQVTVPDWATNVQAGPTTAKDEINGIGLTPAQSLQFVFTQISSNTNLFLTPPVAIIDPATGTAALEYEANPDANGIATFEVVLEDDGPQDASIGDESVSDPPRTFTIDVNAVNDPPTFDLANDVINRLEDSGPFSIIQVINISPGPTDEQSQTVAFEIEPLPPEFASLFVDPPTINSDGLLRFTPALNQNTDNVNGPAVIRVIGRDSAGAETAAAEFQISVTEVNDPPRAFSDSIDTDEDTVLTIDEDFLMLNDVDPDLLTNASEVVRVEMPAQSFSVSGASVSFDSATGQITYDPTDAIALQSLTLGETLIDSFAYSLIDAANAKSNLVTVALHVDGINDAPIVELDTPQLNRDGPTIIPVLDNDTDVDGFIVQNSIQIKLQPAFGSVTALPNGTLQYSPFASFIEEDTFTYTVADNLGLRSEQALVTISLNASPVAMDDARGTFLDESVVIDVAANDRDPDGTLDLASIVIVTQPLRGEAIPQADGTVQYLPDSGFLGRDSFTYQISDIQGRASNVATVDTQVVASRLQNPDRFSDVNDDGFVTALDALLIINHLSRSDGASSIPVLPTDQGPNFYDVSGNQQISASDALRVINELGREDNGGINAEQVPQALVDHSDEESDSPVVLPASPIDLASPAKIMDTSMTHRVANDVVDLIAADREGDQDDESLIDAVDAAMADLL